MVVQLFHLADEYSIKHDFVIQELVFRSWFLFFRALRLVYFLDYHLGVRTLEGFYDRRNFDVIVVAADFHDCFLLGLISILDSHVFRVLLVLIFLLIFFFLPFILLLFLLLFLLYLRFRLALCYLFFLRIFWLFFLVYGHFLGLLRVCRLIILFIVFAVDRFIGLGSLGIFFLLGFLVFFLIDDLI